ncbi:MAG: ubiquinol-cytochrome C chaperone family protein [Bauldia sp.]
MLGRARQKAAPVTGAAESLYMALVAAARRPAPYRDYGVPDTVEGRFDMIVLHVGLLLHRLAGEGAAGQSLAQAIVDRFFADMDRSLREMGVSDLGMSRRMREMAGNFYGRLAVYTPAMASRDARTLAEAIGRNLFADKAPSTGAVQLARYSLAAIEVLKEQASNTILAGRMSLPDLDPRGWTTRDERRHDPQAAG